MKGHTHSYTDNMLQSGTCQQGWEENKDIAKGPWENSEGVEDPNCKKESVVTSHGGDETRPKNIHVINIMKIVTLPWLSKQTFEL